MSLNLKSATFRTILIILMFLLCIPIMGCPGGEPEDTTPEETYRIGTWAGTVKTEARLVLLQYPQYFNMAWRIEADVRLVEYLDGTMSGTATGNLFYWHEEGDQMLDFNEIATGRWDQFANFQIDITGTIDDANYHLLAGELPLQLPDANSQDTLIDFWDFLYPEKIEGRWDDDTSGVGNLMEGQSLRVQGKDYRETAQLSTFREFGITYNWSIRKL